ncbi:MAG: hypothetical protein Q4E35_06395, partial [Eubacteriales bacterium]|nr:hypothetical protein [Eubacteriales bacterium]
GESGGQGESGSGEQGGSEGQGGDDPVIPVIPTVVPTIAPSVPAITKNPGAETVKSGEGCIFIAKADNYTGINWYFTKNGQVVYASEAAQKFPGLKVSGDGTEIFSLESVPDSLNGWNVGAVFTNAVGKQGTATCTITVTPSASPSPRVTATPKPTASPSPTPAVTPTLRPMVTIAPSAAVTPAITAMPTVFPTPLIEESGRGGISFGLLLITLLVVALLGGAAVIFILYRSGRLELSDLLPTGAKKSGKKRRYDEYDDDDDYDDGYGSSGEEGGYRGKH